MGKVQRLSREGVGASAPKYSLSGNGENDIVCASGKPEDVPVDRRLNCIDVANQCEHKHGDLHDGVVVICFTSFHEKQVGLETIPPRVTRKVPVEDVEATGCMCPEAERPMKQEVSFDM